MRLTLPRPEWTRPAREMPSTLLFLAGEYFQRLVAALPEIRQYFEGMASRRDLENRLVLESDLLDADDGE